MQKISRKFSKKLHDNNLKKKITILYEIYREIY